MPDLQKDLGSIAREARAAVTSARSLHELDAAYRAFLGRSGKVSTLLRRVRTVPKDQRSALGTEANALRKELTKLLLERRTHMEHELFETKVQKERVDVTMPGTRPTVGILHPLIRTRRRIEDLFVSLGFTIALTREVEQPAYNFDKLNIGPEHPARDIMDTFWLTDGNLLRTHTSAAQGRVMAEHRPPFRLLIPGRVFRYEATDASHNHTFYQFEGLMVDTQISVANFMSVVHDVLRGLFEKNLTMRLRPGYFPFVEPGFEVDIDCPFCRKGCAVCSHTGWVEIVGAGMIHPQVLKNVGIDPKRFQGFAFGGSIDRLAMMQYGIDDIRLFHGGDLRFLEQFV